MLVILLGLQRHVNAKPSSRAVRHCLRSLPRRHSLPCAPRISPPPICLIEWTRAGAIESGLYIEALPSELTSPFADSPFFSSIKTQPKAHHGACPADRRLLRRPRTASNGRRTGHQKEIPRARLGPASRSKWRNCCIDRHLPTGA